MSSLMLLTALASLGLVAQDVRPTTQSDRPASLVISANRMNAGGQTLEIKSQSGTANFEGYLWSDTLCSLTSSATQPASAPVAGWHFSTRMSPQSDGSLEVRIEWQRRWQSGVRASGPSRGTLSRTFVPGERIVVDRVQAETIACGTAHLRLEAFVVGGASPSAALGRGGRGMRGSMPSTPAPTRGVPGGRGAAAAPSVRPQVSGRGGRGSAAPATPAPAQVTGRGGRASVPTQRPQTSAGRGGRGSTTGRPTYTAELWLVHQSPESIARAASGEPTRPMTGRGGRTSTTPVAPARGGRGATGMRESAGMTTTAADNQILRATQSFSAAGTGFAFPAMSIPTDQGTVTVIVTGIIRVKQSDGTPEAVVVSIRRHTTTPDGDSVAEGTNGTQEIPWSRAGDVVSFELPLPRGARDPLQGHRIELRMRVRSLDRPSFVR